MSEPITIKIERTLDRDFISDVLVTAFDGQYGACWTWCGPYGRFFVESTDDLWEKVHIGLDEETGIPAVDSQDHFTVDHEVVRIGIQRLLDGDTEVGTYALDLLRRGVLEGDAGDIDAIVADCIVQAGLFGEVIYG